MANKYAVASGSWSSTSTWSDTDGGGGGAAVPADGDTVYISAGVSVLMDVDQSAWTGLQTVTIRGASGTPGMLYWADNTSGYLKVRTGYNIVGTSGTNKGRLLANSNGTWGGTTALANTYKATISLAGTAKIAAQYLDIALYCTQPTKYSVRTYKDKYDFTANGTNVDVTNNTIDLGVTPPAQDTKVRITTAAGTLPAGLEEECIYYVRGISGTKCKLSAQANDTAVIDLTSTGSGTCTLYTGHTNTGTATINVLDDVTSDAPWTTTDGWDRVSLVSCDPTGSGYDQQRGQLTTINAGSLVLAANVDSVQWPGARVWLISRNVQILWSGTSGSAIDYTSATTSSGVFQCAIIATAGSGTTFYGTGILYGTGHTISGTMSGFYTAVNSADQCTISARMISNYAHVENCVGCDISGALAGSIYFGYYGGVHTISASMEGMAQAAPSYGPSCKFSGRIYGCATGITGAGHRITSTSVIVNCGNAISSTADCVLEGSIYACGNAVYSGEVLISSGAIGYILSSGARHANGYDFYVQPGSYSLHVVGRGALIDSPPSFFDRNIVKYGWDNEARFEDYGRTLGASVNFAEFGTVTKQSSTVRTGGAASALKVEPLSNCGAAPTFNTRILIFEWTELSVPASSMTRSVWMRGFGWSSWPTASELWFEAEYVSDAMAFARTTAKSTAVLTDNSTWVQFSVTFTPAAAAHVRYRAWLGKYAASSGVYVDAQLS